ncbi:Alpha-galactosidase [Rhynchospora pubera]|uniref:Alpha-galactosidase n=1 Tax=Rhynchospora pubera TaxID=906938 RepID=A0AAV8GRR6_9POAL|nr:Alpha-galactosidase [Rhynchospora pubera]
MRASLFLALVLCANFFYWGCCKEGEEKTLAKFPPRGWNSYDSFSWIIDEEAFLQNAEILAQKLLPHGYEYAVIDFLWYRKNVDGAYVDSYGYDSIDEWGRPIPDPDRWPSSRGGKGFTEVAKKVHEMGLKFGIHLMRGISTKAVDANAPILDVHKGGVYSEDGRNWTARDIGLTHRTCGWMQHGFMSVNTDLGAGKAFLRSLYHLYTEWGVDFVKLDCVFGDDYDSKEISSVSQMLEELDRPVVLSISPGTRVTPSMAETIYKYVNMYRITADDWDTWSDVASHFNISRDFASVKKIGAEGLRGRSWPDLDMLPLGWLTDPGVQQGPHRKCYLTLDEQKTQMTLWSIAKSPLMFGGDLRNLDGTTLSLISNPTLLEINSYSSNNLEFPHLYTTEKHLGKKNHIFFKFKETIYQQKHEKKILGLTSCTDEGAKGWHASLQTNQPDQICWNLKMIQSDNLSHCLIKFSSDEHVIHNQEHKQYFHLATPRRDFICLDASSGRKGIASERQDIKLTSCKWHASQMWSLNDDGTLVNSYSNSCAAVNSYKVSTTSGGIRSWIATGRRGEIYLAFFNLNPVATRITAKVSEVRDFIGNSFFREGSCNCTEVWSGKNIEPVRTTISATVNSHGCSLFVLTC